MEVSLLFNDFVSRMNASSLFQQASRGADFTIQFRIIPAVHRAPLNTFAGSEGQWWNIVIKDGKAELAEGDRRASVDVRSRVEYECEADSAAEILTGATTVGKALLDDRLVAGGVLAHFAGTLIHLTHCGDDGSQFLPGGYVKAFLR